MAYFSLGSFCGIFFETFVLIILTRILIQCYRTYRITRMKMTLDLTIAWFFVVLGVFFSWIAKFYLTLNAEDDLAHGFMMQLIYKFKISLVCVVIASLFFSTFFKTIFSQDGKRPEVSRNTLIRKSIEITIIISVQIPTALTGNPDIALIMDTIAFFITVLDSLFFLNASRNGYKKSKEAAFGKKYLSISIMAFLMFASIPMFFIDRLIMAIGINGLFGELGYSIFYFTAWILIILAETYSFFSYIRK